MKTKRLAIAELHLDPVNARKTRPERRRGQTKECVVCKLEFYRPPSADSQKFCSKQCAADGKRKYPKEERTCKGCSSTFVFSEKPHSNTSGSYCSIRCRDGGYVKAGAHRSKWRSVRNKFVKANDFCCACGKRDGRLHVHHIIPYAVGGRDEYDNLVTACPKCHSALEKYSDKIKHLPVEKMEYIRACFQALLEEYWHLHQGRRLV